MAPSRRKGTSKAASAACRQWKVGDLVLAKVKGFPAWPATVSEPGKWGYPAVWKKVLVYFFGTQQIAFCNPADVEAFTEEKKQSLLIKRHGKGADFVRAVQEIIDSYEKLKKQDQLVDDFNSKEVPCTNTENLVESSAKNGSKDHTEAHEATLDSRLNSSHVIAERDVQALLDKDASATMQTNVILNKDEPADTAVAAEIPLSSSRRRSRSSKRSVLHKEESTVGGPRSSSRVEARRLRSSAELGKDSSKSAVNGSLRRNKRNRKSPDVSECDDVSSSAFLLSGSIEDNGSEIVTVDCDTYSHNEGSTTDLGCKLEQTETVAECLEGDVQLNKGLDVQIKAVIKKRRKPNRKRLIADGGELAGKIYKKPVIDVSMHNTSETSENNHQEQEQVNRICFKEDGDGDEHLPLVKRARVRMGKSSSAKEELNSLPNTEENNQNEFIGCPSGPMKTSLTCDMDSSADGNPFVANGALDKVSSSQVCTQSPGNQLNFFPSKKDHSFSLVDGEAVLPPSKRLHRALEAMSANAAEEGQTCTDASSSMKTLYNSCLSSASRCPRVTPERKTSNNFGVQDMDLVNTDIQYVDASRFSPSSDPVISEENTVSSMESDLHNQINITKVQNNESREVSQDFEDRHGDCKFFNECDGICTVVTAVQAQSVRRAQCSVDESLPPNDDGNPKTIELSNNKAEDEDKEFDGTEQHIMMIVDPASSSGDDIVEDLPKGNTSVVPFSAEDAGCEIRSLEPHLIDKREVHDMSLLVEEILDKQGQKDPSSISFPNGNLGDGCIFRISSCLTDGNNFLGQGSLPNALTGPMPTSDSSNYFQTNGSCSRDAHLYRKPTSCTADGKFESVMAEKPKCLGKNPDQSALSFFETMLGTLTRTKESIGRATRVAIDCAKFGAASKVLEIIVRSLEAETSLHRRVDFFFLVDSILKGDDDGFFPSVIQANLPRLLSATAPPGSSAHENSRQCLKVLRLWLERRILPESIIRHHIRGLDSLYGSSGVYSRRSSRTERSLDDPLREMEGMLVDEYGSNSSFQLPGFCMPCMLKDDDDEGSDSDGENFEAVTPERDLQNPEEHEIRHPIVNHRHILEDVDGELEMEDVAPPCEMELASCFGGVGGGAAQKSHYQFEQHHLLPFAPPLPQDVPPSSPPLPSSPPPPPLPPLALPSCPISNSHTSDIDSMLYPDPHLQRMPDHMVQSVAQRSNVPKINQPVSDAACNHPSECGDLWGQMTGSTSSSFSSFSVQPVRNVPQADGISFHNNGYPWPPHPPPMNQFTYVREDQHFEHRRESAPPSYYNRFHSIRNGDRENYYNNHERMKPGPYEPCDSWRFPSHSLSGSRYSDKGRSYGHASYMGPPFEPSRYPSQGWRSPPWSMSRRNSMRHFRPHFEGPGYWQPR